jgi:hypothetical protein
MLATDGHDQRSGADDSLAPEVNLAPPQGLRSSHVTQVDGEDPGRIRLRKFPKMIFSLDFVVSVCSNAYR